jgi:hypothetical protein
MESGLTRAAAGRYHGRDREDFSRRTAQGNAYTDFPPALRNLKRKHAVHADCRQERRDRGESKSEQHGHARDRVPTIPLAGAYVPKPATFRPVTSFERLPS